MTKKSYHPSADLLLSYSAGTASTSQALCVATHLEFCSECRKIHKRNNAIGGKLLDDIPNSDLAKVDNALKLKVLGMLDNAQAISVNQRSDKIVEAENLNKVDSVPRTLQKLIPDGFKKLKWSMVSATARNCQLFKDDNGVTLGLLKLKPGGQIAKHKHMGDEYTVVLTGAFSDEEGVYRAGDFLHRDMKDCHSPVATKDAECICLILQEGPLQFTGPFFKLFNPLLRSQFQSS